jgi:hypothetical protein
VRHVLSAHLSGPAFEQRRWQRQELLVLLDICPFGEIIVVVLPLDGVEDLAIQDERAPALMT